jgi:hypothetical protein
MPLALFRWCGSSGLTSCANIFNRIDYQEMSKKVKVDIRPNQLLIFGRGAGGP